MEKQKFYLVAADALPEVFLRVAEAKRMLQVGEAATVGDAARQVGISRSAFYKYKALTTTLGPKGAIKLKNPPAKGRSILRTFCSPPERQHLTTHVSNYCISGGGSWLVIS